MPRGLVALFALLEALFVVGVGVLIPVLFGIVGWASLSGFRSTPLEIWQLGVQVWALGHGVPMKVALSDTSAVLGGDLANFELSLAPFAFALLTALVGRRAGRRLAGSDDATLVVGLLVGFVAALAVLVLMSGNNDMVALDVPSGTARVLAPFVVGLIVGWKPWVVGFASRPVFGDVPEAWRDIVRTAGRIVAATFAGLVAIASLLLAVLVVMGFATEISLYESLHAGIAGGFVITALQLAFLPVAVVWAIAWVAGPGFALGAGAVVSPFATTVGALPAIPLLGAIPSSTTVGWWVTLIPGLIALVAAARVDAVRGIREAGLTAAASALLAALATVSVGSYASGSAGPARFTHVGIDPILFGAVVGIGVAVGAFAGLVIGQLVREAQYASAAEIRVTPPR